MSEERSGEAIEEIGEQDKSAIGEKREQSTTGGVKDIDELYRALLNKIWSLTASAIGVHAVGDLPFEANPLLSVLTKHFEPEEFFVDEAPSALILDSRPLRGTMHDMILRATMDVGKVMHEPEDLQAYYKSVISLTLERMLRDEIGTPENQVDLVLLPLTNSRFRALYCSPSLRLFVATLWAHLALQADEARTGGWVSTAGILAEYLRFSGEEPCLHQSAFYFYHLLTFCVKRLGEGTLATQDDLDRLRGVAANLANILETLRRLKGVSEESPDLGKMRQALKKITAATVLGAFSEEERRTGRLALARFLGVDWVEDWWPEVLDDMMNSTTAWNKPDRPYRLLLLELSAGLSRAGSLRRVGNAPSSFYNAGVSLTRLRGGSSASREAAEEFRALVNAVGFWYAARSSDDAHVALITNDGLDCCRNMLDACGSLSWRPEQVDVVKKVVAAVYAFKAVVPAEAEFFQMRTSIRAVGVALPDDVGRPSLSSLAEAVREMLEMVAARMGIDDMTEDAEPLRSAELIRRALLLVVDEAELEEARRDVRELMADISSLGQSPRVQIPAFFEHHLGSSPVVIAGLATAEEWARVEGVAVVSPSSDLGSFLKSDEAVRWMVERR